MIYRLGGASCLELVGKRWVPMNGNWGKGCVFIGFGGFVFFELEFAVVRGVVWPWSGARDWALFFCAVLASGVSFRIQF